MAKTASKSFSLSNSSQKLKYFKILLKLQISQVQAKILTNLSVSYDYGARNFDEYFHFYGIAGQKFKMKEILKKKINKCMP